MEEDGDSDQTRRILTQNLELESSDTSMTYGRRGILAGAILFRSQTIVYYWL